MNKKRQLLTLLVILGVLMPVATPYADSNKMRQNIKQSLSWMPKGLRSDDALELLTGTAAQESLLGKLPDKPGMGGRGPFQVNPKTEERLWQNHLRKNPKLAEGLTRATGVTGPNPEALSGNFPYAVAMARLAYAEKKEPLPSRFDPVSMGNYWKTHYNTEAGQGTAEKFTETYHRLVGGRKR
jgi:hypothetical protein